MKYLFIFNPWLQSSKFDESCEYIKKWLPELKDIPNEDLHKWDERHTEYDMKKLGYGKPIVNYKTIRVFLIRNKLYLIYQLKIRTDTSK